MKRLISGILLLAMFISLFAGCNKNAAPETTGAPVTQAAADANLADAVAYVKTIYKEVAEITAADYQRIGVVPMGDTQYEILWTVNVAEDLVKIVKGSDGMVTIDVNEESEEEVPYVLTATLTGTDGVQESLSWNHILPKAVGDDQSAIVGMAYALEDGQAMDFEATLTGTISAINTAWSDAYQNITVTMLIKGLEDKPIMCYRLTGEGAKDLAIGDLITVTGTLKNYKGTIEFDAGCVLTNVQAGAGSVAEAPTDAGEIIAAAYGLGEGQSLPYNATLTGKIIRVDTKWSSQYKNITVTMVVDGYEDKPIMCYRLKGDGAEDLCIEDTITVSGMLKNYYGTIEFDAGCTLVDVVPGPRTPITFREQPDDVLKIMQDAYKLTHGHFLPYNVILTGLVTEVNTPWSNKYGNITVTIEMPGAEGYPLECYRMVGQQYGADKIEVGDTITVHGSVTNYKGTIELAAGCWCYEVVKGEGNNNGNNDSQFAKDLEEAAQLGEDETLSRASTITGIITSTPYESSYTKGTYSFWVKDSDGNSVQCYYVPVVGGVPAKGDTVTVTGYLSAYDGKGQFYEDNATATIVSKAEEDTGDDSASANDPAANSTLTVAEAIALGKSKAHNTYTTNKYYVTGVITEIYNETYGNMYIKDASGNILTIYGSYSEDGKTRFDALVEKPKAGDTITVYGVIGQYNDIAQMKNAWIKGTKGEDSSAAEATKPDTFAEQMADAVANGTNAYTSTFTGTVSETARQSDYNGMRSYSFTLSSGNDSVFCYKINISTDKYIADGDTVTITAKLTSYNGKAQFAYTPDSITITHPAGSTDPDAGTGDTDDGDDDSTATIPDTFAGQMADAVANGTNAYASTFTGTVSETARQPDYNGMRSYSFTLSDGTDSVLCYKINIASDKYIADGDTVTITGKLTSYNGKAQFAYTPDSITITHPAGSTDPDGGFVKPTTEKEIVDAAFALASGETLQEGPYTLTLTVTKVDGWYSDSSTIKNVYGTTSAASGSKEMLCYKLKADAADAVHVGDVIKVTGTIKNFNGTVEFDANCTYELVSCGHESSDGEFVKPTTASAIVDAAYALEKGETLEGGTYTLTGKITAIGSAYNASYDNVTVTIAVAGKEDKPIVCYRMKGTGADLIDIGDTITVTGTLKNYNDTIEFDAGCSLDSYILAMTPAEIVDALYELEKGESLSGSYTLTGVITKVDTVYSSTYGNVTVTMVVAGKTDKPVQCYRLKGTGADLIDVGDTITVTGTLKNYKGTYEFDSGCSLDSYVLALSPAEIVDAAYALEKGASLAGGPHTLTGKVTAIGTAYNASYGNVTVTIAVAGKEDKPIVCYRMKGDDAATVAVGDTITVTGTLKNYNGTIEFDSGCTFVTVS